MEARARPQQARRDIETPPIGGTDGQRNESAQRKEETEERQGCHEEIDPLGKQPARLPPLRARGCFSVSRHRTRHDGSGGELSVLRRARRSRHRRRRREPAVVRAGLSRLLPALAGRRRTAPRRRMERRAANDRRVRRTAVVRGDRLSLFRSPLVRPRFHIG
jgi:hypothetical protein